MQALENFPEASITIRILPDRKFQLIVKAGNHREDRAHNLEMLEGSLYDLLDTVSEQLICVVALLNSRGGEDA